MTGNVGPGTQQRRSSSEPRLSPSTSLRRHASTGGGDDLEQGLWERYWRTRDLDARNRLVLKYEPLVRQISFRYHRHGKRTSEDLTQVGFMGLIAAIERFDPNQRTGFLTYAVPTIAGCIKHYLRDQSWLIKPPRRLRELGMRLRTLSAEVEVALGRPPTPGDLAEAAGLPEEQVLEAMEVDHLPLIFSLEGSGGEDGGEPDVPVAELVGSIPASFSEVELREAVLGALTQLPPRQQVVLCLRFYYELSQAEVAKQVGISQMHVSRLERDAIQKLRLFLEL